jgi:hypothetical protein
MAEVPSRSRWTDDRIDDLARRVDVYDAPLHELRRLPTAVEGLASELTRFRTEVREEFAAVRSDMRGLRMETQEGFREVRTEGALNRRWLIGLWATTTFGFAGLLVEVGMR